MVDGELKILLKSQIPWSALWSSRKKELDAEFDSICEELRQGRVSTSREADTVAAAVLACKVVSTDKAKKILSRSESDSTKRFGGLRVKMKSVVP